MTDAQFVLGVDLDGVVADFYAGLRPIAAEWLGVPVESLTEGVTYDLPEWNLRSADEYDELTGSPSPRRTCSEISPRSRERLPRCVALAIAITSE